MDRHMKENGMKKVSKMAEEYKFGLMDLSMKVTGRVVTCMEKAD